MQVLRVVDRLGQGHDILPKLWKAAVEQKCSAGIPVVDEAHPEDDHGGSAVDTLMSSVRRLEITPCSKAGHASQDSESNPSTMDEQPLEGEKACVG